MTDIELILYVTGSGPAAEKATSDAQRLCAERLAGRAALTVIDTAAQPERAAADGVRVTPTLLRRTPPERRVVGDLSDAERVLRGLALATAPASQSTPASK